MAIDVRTKPAWLATVLLAEDDTEESVMGSDLHQQAVREAHMSLWEYAAQLGGAEQPAWYVSSEVTVIVPLPERRRVWRPKPDVFVVPGVSAQARSSYDTRREGPMPSFVLEVASESTWENDVGEKATLYQVVGVREYLLFDPTGDYLGEPVRGWHRHEGIWQPWTPVTRADGALVWESVVLGLAARAEGVLLRFDHPQRGPLPIRADLRAALARAAEAEAAQRTAEAAQRDAEDRAQRQQAALEAARAENARLRARLRDQG